MPRESPFVIRLSRQERRVLEHRSRQYTLPYREVVRAKLVLLAATGLENRVIGERLGLPRPVVSKWRQRFFRDRLAGLEERPRSGRPAGFSPRVVALVKAIACELPATLGVPLSRFSRAELRRHGLAAGLVAEISGVTIWRWLREDATRPWGHRSWIFPRDPDFAAKAGPVLDLYHRRWRGTALGPRDFVLSADEKTQIQLRTPRQPITPPGPGRAMRVSSDYRRHGTCAYLAAWDVHRAKLFGRLESRISITAFDALVADVMKRAPYRTARRVLWIVDNGTIHRGDAAIARLQARWPTLILVHLPVHASWLNQVEIYFSILQRKALTPADFATEAAAAERILGFQRHYQAVAQPFDWRFTRRELARLLARCSPQTKPAHLAA